MLFKLFSDSSSLPSMAKFNRANCILFQTLKLISALYSLSIHKLSKVQKSANTTVTAFQAWLLFDSEIFFLYVNWGINIWIYGSLTKARNTTNMDGLGLLY